MILSELIRSQVRQHYPPTCLSILKWDCAKLFLKRFKKCSYDTKLANILVIYNDNPVCPFIQPLSYIYSNALNSAFGYEVPLHCIVSFINRPKVMPRCSKICTVWKMSLARKVGKPIMLSHKIPANKYLQPGIIR